MSHVFHLSLSLKNNLLPENGVHLSLM